MIEQTKFTYSPQGKAFKKQVKTIKGHGEKQKKLLKSKEKNSYLQFMIRKMILMFMVMEGKK